MKTPSPFYRSRPVRTAFTLIELIVVVVVIGVIASLAVPTVMKVQDKAAAKAAKYELIHDEPAVEVEETPPGERLPMFEKFEADYRLSSDYQRVGLEVYSRYSLYGSGRLAIRSALTGGGNGRSGHVSLHVPFPDGTIEASDIYLRILDPETGEAVESREAVYRRDGIFWEGQLAEGEVMEAEFGFTTQGTESVEIALPPARRLSNLDLSLDLSDSSADEVTSYSLRADEVVDQKYHWEFANLVSDRSIVVRIPGAESPGGRLITLFRFMAVAVFLFGGGFLYMNESHAPGRLDRFRLGHFFLLALTYSLFFIIFAVIIYREHLGVIPALALSAVFSLPLLVMHVARITTLRFAIRHVFPLAVVTLALVVNGVYGGGFRDYGFLILLVAVTAYLTATYRPGEKKGRESGKLVEAVG